MAAKSAAWLLIMLFVPQLARGQKAELLNGVRSAMVGSLGSRFGADELRHELINALRHGGQLRVVDAPEQADVIVEGTGELWIRGYHALSPRARVNQNSAEPLYDGYLSIKVIGRGGTVLWSDLGYPKRISFSDVQHDLAKQVAGDLVNAIRQSPGSRNRQSSPLVAATTPNLVLKGGGATFPLPIYEDWFRSFHAIYPSWNLQYEPIGSEDGIRRLRDGAYDFAGSDIPPASGFDSPPQSGLRAMPTVGGAVVLIYNLPDFDDQVKLDSETIAGIFQGIIRTWADGKLKSLNGHGALPNHEIKVVHRSDGSGTTFVFTRYLSTTNAGWEQHALAGAKIVWPTGFGGMGNEGVAKAVADNPYSIGYVEFIYALQHHLRFAAVRNSSGAFISADLASIEAAAASLGAAGETSILNSPSPRAYPISAFTWLVYRTELDPGKREAILRFAEWMLDSGQRSSASLGYAPLPVALVERERAQVNSELQALR